MEELNKIVRAIGSFILTCIFFACPIGAVLFIQNKHVNFLTYVLTIVSIIEFIFVLGYFYISSEE